MISRPLHTTNGFADVQNAEEYQPLDHNCTMQRTDKPDDTMPGIGTSPQKDPGTLWNEPSQDESPFGTDDKPHQLFDELQARSFIT